MGTFEVGLIVFCIMRWARTYGEKGWKVMDYK